MYLGLAILMGTAWLRLSYSQENIQNWLNALFFGSAFMSFMVISFSIWLIEGGRIYPRLPRRPRSHGQRTCQWSLRSNILLNRQHHHRPSVLMYFRPLLN